MPRGVPRSGVRQPRAGSTEKLATDQALAAGTVDDAIGVEQASDLQDAPTPAPTSNVMTYPDEDEIVVEDAPSPDELTPEQQEIKRLRDMLAIREGKSDGEPEVEEIAQGAEGNILIHFLEDGLSALGKVWVRGQELEFVVGSRAHKDTFDRRGRSWLDLRHDDFAQVERWGKVMFRSGPWPGKTYADGTFEPMRGEREGSRVPPPSEDELARAEKQRKRRAAPHLPQQV